MSRNTMSPGWIMRSEKVCECGRPRGPETELTHSTRSGAHAEQPVVGDGDQLVLARARADRPGDVDVGRVDHGGGQLQQLDLVGVLISRASSSACWPSTTSMPSASSARSIGNSMMSMPIGSLSMP